MGCSEIFSTGYLMTLLGTQHELGQSNVKVAQLCLTLCDPMDSRVHAILQGRILEWASIPFFRGSSQSRDRTQVFHIAGTFVTI